MLDEMSVTTFREWREYFDLEPFGEERADYRAASIVAMLYNINRRRGTPAKNTRDFVLRFGEKVEPRRKTWQEMKAIGAMIAGAANKPRPTRPPKRQPVKRNRPTRGKHGR